MLRILILPVVLALALCGCSKNEEGSMSKANDSATKASDSAKDTPSNAANAPKDVAQATPGTAGTVKEASGETKDAAANAGQKAKEGARQAKSKTTDKAKEARAANAKNWSDFQVMLNKCDALTGAEKKQCIIDAQSAYGASNFDCESMTPQDKVQCREYREQWKSAKAEPSQANAPAVRSGEPNTVPADPGDPSDKERNRDSTKQQATAQQPQRQN